MNVSWFSALRVVLLLTSAGVSAVASAKQPMAASKSHEIADNVKVLNPNGIFWDDNVKPETKAKVVAINEAFVDMTAQMIEQERQRQEDLGSLILWTTVSGYIAFVLAHLFLVFGFWLGGCELLRAYRLRKSGVEQQLEVQLNLEGAAIKGSLYGFLVFGASLVFYFAYLRFVYPITVIE